MFWGALGRYIFHVGALLVNAHEREWTYTRNALTGNHYVQIFVPTVIYTKKE